MLLKLPRNRALPLALVAFALIVAIGAAVALLLTGGESSARPSKTAAAAVTSGKGYLGLTVMAAQQQLLKVATIEAKGPAASAGVQIGDFIRAVDGRIVRTPEQLRNAVEVKSPGAQVTLTYERGDQSLQALVKLGNEPLNAQIESTAVAPPAAQNQPPGGQAQLGIQLANITPALKQRYNLNRDAGVVITGIQPNGPAASAGLQAGDVILALGDQTVATVAETMRLGQAAAATGKPLSIRILRGTADQTVQVQSPQAIIAGIESLPPQLQQLLRSGALTPGQINQLQSLIAQNPAGAIRLGKVTQINESSLVLTPIEGGAATTFALSPSTQVRRAGNAIQTKDLQPGTTVLLVSNDGQAATAIVAFGS